MLLHKLMSDPLGSHGTGLAKWRRYVLDDRVLLGHQDVPMTGSVPLGLKAWRHRRVDLSWKPDGIRVFL